MKKRVVITGMGAVSPIGNNVSDMWANAKKGFCAIGQISKFDTSKFKTKLAAEVKDVDFEKYLDKKDLRKLDFFTRYAMIASQEAFNSANLNDQNFNKARAGVIVSSGIGGLKVIEQEYKKGLEKGFERVSPFFIPMAIANMAAGLVAIQHGLHGMSSSSVTACASSTNALGDAFRHIREGHADIMVCGGAESSITELGIGGFASLRALSESKDPNRASIPFDKERNGFIMGEGAGILILEEYQHAIKREANIISEVVGYASNCDAYHMTAPNPEGIWAARCMEGAIREAQIDRTDIDYINAHGTSTPMNDKCETMAIKKAFKEHAYKLMLSSTKAMTGHLLGATGAIEAILTSMMLKEGYILATINHRIYDEDCDLDIVANEARSKKIKYALSNSFGFGGHNATIVLKKYEGGEMI